MARYTLRDSQDRSTLRLRIGDAVVLRLRESPGGECRWHIAFAHGFELEADDFSHMPDRASCAGERALRFKAVAAGTARIEAVLRRTREPAPALRHFSVTAEIF